MIFTGFKDEDLLPLVLSNNIDIIQYLLKPTLFMKSHQIDQKQRQNSEPVVFQKIDIVKDKKKKKKKSGHQLEAKGA